jgi:hypothetical protein
VVGVIIDQRDIAHLSDDQVRLLVLAVVDAVGEMDRGPGGSPALPDFWRRFVVALIRARRERARILFEADCDLINDDGPGALVGPGEDPVADALEELRRGARGESPL